MFEPRSSTVFNVKSEWKTFVNFEKVNVIEFDWLFQLSSSL